MAAGHILPIYSNPVTRLRRVRSASHYSLDSTTLQQLQNAYRLDKREFEQIKENARQLWSKNTSQLTTYGTFFGNGELTEIAQSRPTSRHWRNNPHPSQVFLTNRLHYVKDCFNPDSTTGHTCNLNDDHMAQEPQALHLKYIARPDPVFINVYKDPYGFKQFLPPRRAQAAESWVKLADDADHHRVIDILKEQGELKKEDEASSKPTHPSLYRWMKRSGIKEHDATARMMQTPRSNLLKKYESFNYTPQHFDHKREEEISLSEKYCVCPQMQRGEFSMHPDWPSSLPHHRVP